jgi:MOSC domain-containing protein YiiM
MTGGRIERIWIKPAHRIPMKAVACVELVEGKGVAGSVDRSRRRQVTLLAAESWQRCLTALKADTDPGARRANILVSGIRLAHTRGRVLQIGAALVEVGGELTPCERMDEALPGLQAELRKDWGGGVFGQVLRGGEIAVGDPVAFMGEVSGSGNR